MMKRKKDLLLLLILAVATFYSLYGLESRNLWWDEVVNFFTARQSLREILSALQVIPFPPLYFQLLHQVIRFGSSEFLLRLLSALFGILSVFVLYRFTKKTAGGRAALLAALLLALSPMRIWYSQEASPHIMEMCLALLANYRFYLFLCRPCVRRLFFWVLFTVSSFYTAHHALLLLPTQLMLFLFMRRDGGTPGLGRWYAGGLALQLALYVPQMYGFARAVRSLEGFWIPPVEPRAIAYSITNFFLGYSGGTPMYWSVFAVFCVALVAVFFVPGLGKVRRVFIAFGVCPLLTVFLMHPFLHVYIDRHNMLFMPPFFMVMAAGIIALKPGFPRRALACVLCGILFIGTVNYCRNIMPLVEAHGHKGVYIKKDVVGIVRYIAERRREGDMIASASFALLGPVNYYSPPGTTVYYLAAEHDDFWNRRMEAYKTGVFPPGGPYIIDARPAWGKIIFLDSPDTEESALSALPERIWLLQSSWARDGRLEKNALRVDAILGQRYVCTGDSWIGGVRIGLYQKLPE